MWFLRNPLQVFAFLCRPKNIRMFSWAMERELRTEMG